MTVTFVTITCNIMSYHLAKFKKENKETKQKLKIEKRIIIL